MKHSRKPVKVLITGSNGFLAKNVRSCFDGEKAINLLPFNKKHEFVYLRELILKSDYVFHFAGANRPTTEEDFVQHNIELTKEICSIVSESDKNIPILFSSSIQAGNGTLYGDSKLAAEEALFELFETTRNPVHVMRLPNLFGIFGKPYYNSVVSTFCYQILNGEISSVHDKNSSVKLTFVGSLVNDLKAFALSFSDFPVGLFPVETTEKEITVVALKKAIYNIHYSFANTDFRYVDSWFKLKLLYTYLGFMTVRERLQRGSGELAQRFELNLSSFLCRYFSEERRRLSPYQAVDIKARYNCFEVIIFKNSQLNLDCEGENENQKIKLSSSPINDAIFFLSPDDEIRIESVASVGHELLVKSIRIC